MSRIAAAGLGNAGAIVSAIERKRSKSARRLLPAPDFEFVFRHLAIVRVEHLLLRRAVRIGETARVARDHVIPAEQAAIGHLGKALLVQRADTFWPLQTEHGRLRTWMVFESGDMGPIY